jgi:hypothetical protein
MRLIDAFMDMAIPMMRVDPSQRNLGAKWEALKAVLRNRHLKPEIMALIGSPAYVSIMERFEHPVTQSAMCALLGAAGPITNEATGIYFALLGFIHRFGLGRAVGGMQTLSNALGARLTELGGEILLSTQIKEIVAEGGRATGVRLPDGQPDQGESGSRIDPPENGPGDGHARSPRPAASHPHCAGTRQRARRLTTQGRRGPAKPGAISSARGDAPRWPQPAQMRASHWYRRSGTGKLPQFGPWRSAETALHVDHRAQCGSTQARHLKARTSSTCTRWRCRSNPVKAGDAIRAPVRAAGHQPGQ